jgi:hypothetical protein
VQEASDGVGVGDDLDDAHAARCRTCGGRGVDPVRGPLLARARHGLEKFLELSRGRAYKSAPLQ